jgi:hypothetical protein
VTLHLLTNSAMRCWRRCSKEFFFTYVEGYRAVREAEVLRFGSLVHVGLEAWWRAAPGARLDAALAAMQSDDAFELARATVALVGYDTKWGDEPLTALAVEAEFRAPLMNPLTGRASRTFQLGGKLDVVVRDERDTRVKLMEHKSSSEDIGPGSDYWKRLILDPQISTYFAGGQVAGFAIEECIYDVLGKPGLRPSNVPLLDEDGCKIVLDANGTRVRTKDGKKWRQTGDTAEGWTVQTRPETAGEFQARLTEHVAENPDRYYQRGTVVRLEQETLDAAHDAWSTARNIREAAVTQRWPRNADACVRYGRACPFFPVCTGTAALDDPQFYRRVDHVHEELTPDAA